MPLPGPCLLSPCAGCPTFLPLVVKGGESRHWMSHCFIYFKPRAGDVECLFLLSLPGSSNSSRILGRASVDLQRRAFPALTLPSPLQTTGHRLPFLSPSGLTSLSVHRLSGFCTNRTEVSLVSAVHPASSLGPSVAINHHSGSHPEGHP